MASHGECPLASHGEVELEVLLSAGWDGARWVLIHLHLALGS